MVAPIIHDFLTIPGRLRELVKLSPWNPKRSVPEAVAIAGFGLAAAQDDACHSAHTTQADCGADAKCPLASSASCYLYFHVTRCESL